VPITPSLRVEASDRELEALLVGLALQDWVQLRAHRLPLLYSGHYRYQREPPGRERWQSAVENARHRTADCEDLAAHRVAEYWMKGIRAMPSVIGITPTLRHVIVRMPDGTTEDPSKILGMK